jgi:exonuclease SbcC
MPYRQAQQLDFRDKELFALIGPTGSGKSALLDAITFAFYGKTPRWQESRPGKELISQGESRLTVEVQFQVQGCLYQVIRTVKKTGTHDAQLRHQVEGEFRPLSAERRTTKQVTEDIVGLLGMDYATFTKTLMLPQGQFDRLLKPKEPKERKELLIQLAGLSIYDRAAEKLALRLKPLELEVRACEAALATYEGLDEARVQELEQQREGLQAEIQLGQSQWVLAQENCRQIQTDLEWLAELQQHQQALTELHGRQPAMEQLQQRLQDSARVESWQGQLNHLDQLRAQLSRVAEQLDQARSSQRLAEESQHKATQELQAAHREAQELPALEERKESLLRLQESLEIYAEWTRERESLGLESLQLKEQQEQQNLARLCPALEETILALAACQGELAELGEVSQLAAWQSALDACRSWQQNLSRSEQLEQQQTRLEQSLKRLELSLPEAQAELEQAQVRQNELQQRWEEAQRMQTGAILREQLQLDCPCPVCLQPVHQLPAPPESDPNRAELQRQKLEADQIVLEKQRQLHQWEADLQSQREQHQALTDQHQQAQQETLQSWQQLQERSSEGIWDATELESRVSLARQQDQQRQRAQQELARVTARAAQLETEVQVGNTRRESLLQQIEQQRQQQLKLDEKLAQRRQQLAAALGVEQGFAAVAAHSLSEVQQKIVSLESRQKGAEQSLHQAEALLSQCQQAVRLHFGHHDPLSAQLQLLEEQLQTFLTRMDLADEPALRALLLSGEERERMQQEITDHGQQLHSAEERAKALLDQLQQRRPEVSDLQRARQLQDELDKALQERLRQHGALQQQVRHTREQLDKAARLRQEGAAAQHRLALHKKLSTMVSVTGLKAFVANRLLQEILRLASAELERLSGRYQLRLKDDDILVEDGWNAGETRDVRSLSGGETFLASLSLALAMVEYLAQGSPLESLFIDEGFGTLDPETLEAVTQTLESLQAKGRLVGVITHVTELAERLPVQIRVEKLQGQSRLSACSQFS